ncbi:MAG TPA: hypothetical protein VIN73_09075 [Vicingaceae bacterium]
MKNNLQIVVWVFLILFFIACKNNNENALHSDEINKGNYSIIFQYDENLEEETINVVSRKNLYTKDSSVFFLIFGELDSQEGLKIKEESPSFFMKDKSIRLTKSKILHLLDEDYTPSIWVFKVDTNKINEKTKWYNLSQITDSLIFDFTIIDKADLSR